MLPDAEDSAELPAALEARTVNVYEVPADRPVTVIGLEEPVLVIPPGLEVAVNDVAAAPEPAAVNATVAVVLPVAVAAPIVGALGCRKDLVFCDALDPRIGMYLFYLTCLQLIILCCFPVIISPMTKDERTPDVTY
jgi:hypothetical protein